MENAKPTKSILAGGLLAAALATGAVGQASALTLKVTITNIAPAGGLYLTPVWVGFHNGSFDSYDGGTASAAELEALAEDGNTGPLSGVFGTKGTLVATGTTQTGTRVQATLGGLIAQGASAMGTFSVDTSGANQGADEGGVNVNVSAPYANFLNQPSGGVAPELDFNNYQNGIARVDVEAVPVPAPIALMGAVIAGAGFVARRKRRG